MGLLIDTNIWIKAEKGLDIGLERWAHYGTSYLSAVTASELLQSLERADTPERRLKRTAWIEGLLVRMQILDFDLQSARVHAKLKGLLPKGVTAPAYDSMIAAIAMQHGHAVLTQNVKDFKIFAGLEVLEWTQK